MRNQTIQVANLQLVEDNTIADDLSRGCVLKATQDARRILAVVERVQSSNIVNALL